VPLSSRHEKKVELINGYIERSLALFKENSSQRFAPLIEAMKYSIADGGKRLRPILVLASAESLGLDPEAVLPAAAAVEYIHTYSLIHDDLPAIDDDDERRGKPSSHKKFGEPIAILAGDALLTEAFGQMIDLKIHGNFSSAQVLDAVNLLVHHAGVAGMVGGQLLDVSIEPASSSLPELEFIHIHKTGALILASVLLPTKLCTLSENKVQNIRLYGESLGLAFQISDDLLDMEANFRYSRGPRKKPSHSYSQYVSQTEAKERLNGLIDTAVSVIKDLSPKSNALVEIAEFIRERKE